MKEQPSIMRADRLETSLKPTEIKLRKCVSMLVDQTCSYTVN
jgi:hypothetical protein